jgi:anti-sigma factor RsiW
MATENTPHFDILRLNAFVDGELTPTERAAIAAQIRAQPHIARSHATLARLKACIGESADATLPPNIAIPRKRPRRVAHLAAIGGSALAVCCLLVLAYLAATESFVGNKSMALVGRDAAVTLAALPANPVIPQLDVGGLTLEDVRLERAGDVRLLVVAYRGPHGCLLDLRVSPAGSAVPPGAGSSRYAWEVGPLAYELVAHGMPGWRFALIADAAERETREGQAPDAARRRLREARAVAPPCTG